MPYCGTWSAVTPGTQINLSINCALSLSAGDTIRAVNSVAITVISGADPNASALLVGSPAIDATGKIITQTVGGSFVANAIYCLAFDVATTNGETLNFWGRLPGQSIA